MAHYHWRDLFLPHIWQRGHNYYRDGRVLRIQHCGNYITAEVEGTDMYHVSVALDTATNRIEDFSCDCSYGEDGTPCKHLAALLCALKDADDENASQQESNPAFEQVISLLSVEQMRQLLIQFAQNDSFIWEKILLTATNQLPQGQKQQWQQDLQELTDEATDRHGFIGYEEAYDYCCSLAEYLYDRVPDLLNNGLVMDAFDLVCMVFQNGIERDMDDSDGGLTMLANSCMSDWSKILAEASLEDQKEIYRWFTTEYQKGNLSQMFLEEYIFVAPWNTAIAPELLRFLDQQIQICTEVQQRDYLLNELISYRIHWMERAGVSHTEREAYLQKYHQLSAVREIEIAQAKRNGDWITAIVLLEESKELDADKVGLVARYSEQLIEIYEILHNFSAMRKELEYYLLSFRQDDIKHVEKIKAILSPDEWENMRSKLLDSKTMQYQIYPLLQAEGLFEQMMMRIEANIDIHNLEQYEKHLKQEFPQRCVAVYQTYLYQAMDCASNRKAYWSVIQILKKLKKHPGGKATAQIIADQWKSIYPRRTSMLDELRKAGF